MDDKAYWIALSTSSKIGARTFAKLLARFDNMKEVWQADMKRLQTAKIPGEVIKNIFEVKKQVNPEQAFKKVEDLGITIITLKDKKYPRLLKEIADPPGILYVKGNIDVLSDFSLAIVGSRKYSSYGRQVTEDLTYKLASRGVVIVSGLALGIDGIAHQACLEASGRTIAVLANGLDQVYPVTHHALAKRIIDQGGALISEFPIGTPALKFNFPVRNRIIAGLSSGVIVVEGALKSGSLLTAHSALEYNREVFAIPGDIYRETSLGPNYLIKMGAKLVTSVDDILSELNVENLSYEHKMKEIVPDSQEEAVILTHLTTAKPVHVDKLTKLTKLSIATLNSKLVLMEMKGKVRNLGASQYVLGR